MTSNFHKLLGDPGHGRPAGAGRAPTSATQASGSDLTPDPHALLGQLQQLPMQGGPAVLRGLGGQAR